MAKSNILRFPEILLNSTEAKSLLGKIGANVWHNKLDRIEDELECNLIKQLRKQTLDLEIRNRAAEEGHRSMKQWMVDNISIKDSSRESLTHNIVPK